MDFLPFEYWSGVFFALKIASALITLIFVGIIIFALRNSSYLKFRFGYDFTDFLMKRPTALKKLEKDWNEIVKKINSFNDSDWKLALLEADKLADDVVKNLGSNGSTFGERLENLPPNTIKNIELLLQAHKIRNNIVHDPDYRLAHERAREALADYEAVLKELEAI